MSVNMPERGERLPAEASAALVLPAGAPEYMVAVALGPLDSRLVVTRIRTGQTALLPSSPTVPADPVWAPDGSAILFRAGTDLMRYDTGQAAVGHLDSGLSRSGRTPYAYSPDGRRIAVAKASAVHVVTVGSARERFALPEGQAFTQMRWARNARTLVVLVRDSGGENAALVWIDTDGRTARTQAAPGVTGLLGWDPTTGDLVVSQAAPERTGTQAVVLSPTGEARPLRDADEDEGGEFTLLYRPDTREAVAAVGNEDLGDPRRILLLPPGTAPARPWLDTFPRVDQMSLSADGRWVAFIAGGPDTEPGGDVFVIPFGGQVPARVLLAQPDGYRFATPVLGP
jgi:hypothetical protein